jgi:hypothetical protein
MSRLTALLAVVTTTITLALPPGASACPLCKEAIPADVDGYDGDGHDPAREARAWNNSIYLFVSMPYLLLGVVGLFVYRAMRRAPGANTLPVAPAGEEANDVLSDASPTVRPDNPDRGGGGQPG